METTYSLIRYQGGKLPNQYKGLVYSKWMRSLRHGNDYFKLVDSDSYYKAYGRYIDTLLKQSEVWLAVLTDDLDTVLGFSVCHGATVHYVHVHRDSRRIGIARLLLPPDVSTITHLTKMGLLLWPKLAPNAKFDPFQE